jgi:hypothetical protein
VAVVVRQARPGDGDAIARTWLSAGRYYAGLAPEHFQVPRAEGLAALWDDDIRRGAANSLYLVAESGGHVTGSLAAHLELPEPDAASQLTRDQGQVRLAV